MNDDNWDFFIKKGWIVSAQNLLNAGEVVVGVIDNTEIKIVPREGSFSDCFIGNTKRKQSAGSAERLVKILISLGEDISQEQLIEEIDEILDPYYE